MAVAIVETNTQKVIRVLMTPAAGMEAVMQQVLLLRSVDTAVGVQLDAIGSLVGRARQGVTDDEIYRRYCRAQIVANRSNGVIATILLIADLIINDPAATLTLHNEGIATFALEVGGIALDPAVASVVIELVLKGASAGVRAIIEYATSPPASVFRFDTGPGLDVGHLGGATDRRS